MYYVIGASVPSLHREYTDSLVITSAKIIQLNEYGYRDAPCEKSWKQGLAILSRILAQA